MKYLIMGTFLIMLLVSYTNSEEQKQIDIEKCQLDYIRKLIMESCIRPHERKRNRHRKRHVRHSQRLEEEMIDDFPFELMPPNHTMTIIRRKRNVDDEFFTYFRYCCENMDLCENMRCLI